MSGLLAIGWVRLIIVVVIVAAIVYFANKLGIVSIHFNIGGSIAF